MRKLVESTFVTLDGVIEVSDELARPYFDDEWDGHALDLLEAADALLLGRKTYEVLAGYWPGRSGPISDRINALPKHVASRTLKEATWNATIIEGDVAQAVAKLKAQDGGNILKFGTGELDRTLLEHRLVDEFQFWLIPIVVGRGERLFEGFETTLELLDSTRFKSGVVALRYAPK